MSPRDPDRAPAPGAVVVGFEETEAAGQALDWAAEVAAVEERPLVVVRVLGRGRQRQPVLAQALARVAVAQPSLGAIELVSSETLAADLVRLSHSAHLVVVGSRGHGISRTVPTGQIGTQLARRTGCPVVVVPTYDAHRVREGVLVGVRTGEEARDLLEFAYHHAALHRLPVVVVHVVDRRHRGGGDDRHRLVAEARAALAERHPEVCEHDLDVPGRPARKLLQLAAQMDLLVVGQHRPVLPGESLAGHVRSSIVDRAPCPTVVVPVPAASA